MERPEMHEVVTLNNAAIENFFDGAMPRFAALSRHEGGLRISPLKIRRGEAQEIFERHIPLPEHLKSAISDRKLPLAVRMDESGDLIVYPSSQKRKAFQPSARLDTVALPSVTKTQPVPRSKAVSSVEEPPKLQSFLIRGADLVRPSAAAKPAEIMEDDDAGLDTLERILKERWVGTTSKPEPQSTPRPQLAAPVAALHFAETPEPSLARLGERAHVKSVISVPVAFDKRRGLGNRAVQVLVKRRRALSL